MNFDGPIATDHGAALRSLSKTCEHSNIPFRHGVVVEARGEAWKHSPLREVEAKRPVLRRVAPKRAIALHAVAQSVLTRAPVG